MAHEVCALTNKEQRTLIEPVTDVQDYFNIFTTFTKFYRLSEAINRYDVVPLTTNAFETLQTTTSSFQAVNTTTEDVMQSSGLASLCRFYILKEYSLVPSSTRLFEQRFNCSRTSCLSFLRKIAA